MTDGCHSGAGGSGLAFCYFKSSTPIEDVDGARECYEEPRPRLPRYFRTNCSPEVSRAVSSGLSPFMNARIWANHTIPIFVQPLSLRCLQLMCRIGNTSLIGILVASHRLLSASLEGPDGPASTIRRPMPAVRYPPAHHPCCSSLKRFYKRLHII